MISDKIFLKEEENLVENEKAVFLFDNMYFGPFEIFYRMLDKKYYIIPNASNNNYLIPFYTTNSVEPLVFEKQDSSKKTYSTTYVHIIGEASLYDAITDDILIDAIKDNNIPLDLAINDSKEFVQMCKKSPFFSHMSNSSENVSNNRIKRIMDIIETSNDFEEKKQEMLRVLSDQYPDITNQIINNSGEIQKKDSRIRSLEQSIDNLNQEIDDLNKQLVKQNETVSSSATPEEIQKYKDEILRLNNELSDLKNINTDIEQLKNKNTDLTRKRDDLIAEVKKYKTQKESLAEEVQEEVKNAIEKASKKRAEIAFDPYISDAMIKVAAQWDSETEDASYAKDAENFRKANASSLSEEELIKYIVNYVQERKKYDYNDIINIYISVAQNFLTIFSGEPGTGKTSMCDIIGETLGLSSNNRFTPVSVERGWSSKRDFIGYFNPLTRKYDKSNSKVYNALRILDIENKNSKYPYVIMLDEANLSPIEYYWADFMRLTDRETNSDSYINIGTEQEIFIPETLRFVATINTDQTTEILSPRLIDRACIIKLPEIMVTNNQTASTAPTELLTWFNFTNTFSKDSELRDNTKKVLEDIYSKFNRYGMNVSPRIQLMIEKYVKSAQEIMLDGVASKSETAIDYAVLQKLLPKINGYYSYYEEFFKQLKDTCNANNLKMTAKAIDKMIANQEKNMGYCQYLI